jgi:photosystem II stability/assembly factor-like uncharacterized protein
MQTTSLITLSLGLALLAAPTARAQTPGGLRVSEDWGRTWRAPATAIPAGARIVLLEPNGERLLAATDGHGLFLSDAQRGAWTQIGTSLPGVKVTAVLGAGDEIYAAVFRQGLFLTKDEGTNWVSQNGDLENLNVRAVLKVEGALLVATDVGIFRRAAGQASWRKVFSGGQMSSLNQAKGRLVAGGARGTVLSVDHGEHWDWISQAGAAHTTEIIDDRIFLMNISGDLLTSDDGGKTWRKHEYHPHEGSYIYSMVKAGSHLLFSNNYGIHRSADAGKTWELIFKTEEIAFLDLFVVGNRVYGGTAGWKERRGKSG